MNLFPDADVPMFQVLLPARLDAQAAWAFEQALAIASPDCLMPNERANAGTVATGSAPSARTTQPPSSPQRHTRSSSKSAR